MTKEAAKWKKGLSDEMANAAEVWLKHNPTPSTLDDVEWMYRMRELIGRKNDRPIKRK